MSAGICYGFFLAVGVERLKWANTKGYTNKAVYIQNNLVVNILNYAVHKIALSSPSPTGNSALLYFTLLKVYKI